MRFHWSHYAIAFVMMTASIFLGGRLIVHFVVWEWDAWPLETWGGRLWLVISAGISLASIYLAEAENGGRK